MNWSAATLVDLIDSNRLQKLFQGLFDAFGIAARLVAPDGSPVTGPPVQSICDRFYHRHDRANRLCAKFDRKLFQKLESSSGPHIFKCPHGLREAAVCLRMENELFGILFSGQFFHEAISARKMDVFQQQAATYGFEKNKFLAAVKALPVISETRIKAVLTFLENMAACIVELGHVRILERLTSMELARAYWKTSQDYRRLEQLNQALKAMMDHREIERQAIEADLTINIKKHIMPYLEQMENCSLDRQAKTLVKVIKCNMEDLLTPLSGSLPAQYKLLTPGECKVADLVRQGLSTKQIATTLFLSHHTVTNIRNNIRKKLGLTGKKQSLKTFFETLEKQDRNYIL